MIRITIRWWQRWWLETTSPKPRPTPGKIIRLDQIICSLTCCLGFCDGFIGILEGKSGNRNHAWTATIRPHKVFKIISSLFHWAWTMNTLLKLVSGKLFWCIFERTKLLVSDQQWLFCIQRVFGNRVGGSLNSPRLTRSSIFIYFWGNKSKRGEPCKTIRHWWGENKTNIEYFLNKSPKTPEETEIRCSPHNRKN